MARLLSTLLIAFAILCAPVAMHMGGGAMAMPADVQMDAGCEGMGHHAPAKQKSDTQTSCAVACAAIPCLPAALPSEAAYVEARPYSVAIQPMTGIGPEAEIPPPRFTPAI